MKASLFVLLLSAMAFAQNATTAAAPGCGTTQTKFDVKTDKSQHPMAQLEGAKAVVYFVEDDTDFRSTPRPVTRVGIDGTWVGANKGNSYFSLSVDPGEHHICANWQNFVGFGAGHQSAAAHFTADPGQAYFFRIHNSYLLRIPHIELTPLDSDEGRLLAGQFGLSTFHPKN